MNPVRRGAMLKIRGKQTRPQQESKHDKPERLLLNPEAICPNDPVLALKRIHLSLLLTVHKFENQAMHTRSNKHELPTTLGQHGEAARGK